MYLHVARMQRKDLFPCASATFVHRPRTMRQPPEMTDNLRLLTFSANFIKMRSAIIPIIILFQSNY